MNGADYEIHQTAIVVFPNGEQLFVVKALYDGPLAESERPAALTLARYAVAHGYPARANTLRINGKPPSVGGNVGVALMRRVEAVGQSIATGYRFRFSAEELSGEAVLDNR